MNIAQIQMIYQSLAENDMVGAANLALAADDIEGTVAGKKEAFEVLKTLERNLADEGRFLEIATLLWGNEMFDSRPQCVRDVFEEIATQNKTVIIGASSMSKTFSAAINLYLRWRIDSYWTAVKFAGPSEDHLYTNLFSHLCALHRRAMLPITEDDTKRVVINETNMLIRMADSLPEMGIQGLLCRQNHTSSGSLRGHKPKPYRTEKHPKYGSFTCLYILIDEGTQVPAGAFEDIKTTEASINPAADNVKIIIACNPEDVSRAVVKMAEPEEGWDVAQVDTLYKYIGKSGYHVLRLDGKKCENVVQRRVVYPGLMTYESFLGFLKAGEHSGSYWAKGRGFPPLQDNAWTVVPPAWMQSQRGEPIYTGKVRNIAVLDPAGAGADKVLMGVGRFGESAGWRKMDGTIEWFVNRANPDQRITKHCAVLDQIFQLPKTNSTVETVQEVMGRCKMMNIGPEDTCFDCTGMGAGIWGHAKKYWGDVLGVNFGNRASETKVLTEDQLTAYDMYDGKVTELWWAMRRWLDPVVGALYINPIVPNSPLFSQVTTRRYRNVKGGKVRVEPKEEYKARSGGVSPDEADLLTLLVEFCRERCGVIPGIQESKEGERNHEDYQKVSLQNADEPETLSGSDWEPNRLEQTQEW